MARHETDGNIITDKATGLQWVKNPRLILPGFTGSLGASQGFWSPTAGTYTARNLVAVSSSQQFARGQAMAEGAVYLHALDEYLGGGDSTWYKCLQGYTPNARQPGVDAGWASYWAPVEFFEGMEGITYTSGAYRLSWVNWEIYRCISGYTTGESPDDPYDDSTHWELVTDADTWAEDETWSPGDLVTMGWSSSAYVCTVGHTGTYCRPGTANGQAYWTFFARGYGPVSISNGHWNWYTNDPRYFPLYLYCKETHTAASDKGPGNATYWGVYDPFWWVVCPPDWYNLVPPGWNAYNAMDGDWGETFSHNAALDALNALTYEGRNDWRMPNALEAMTRVDFETRLPFTAYQDAGLVRDNPRISTAGPHPGTGLLPCPYRLVIGAHNDYPPFKVMPFFADDEAGGGVPFPVRGGVVS